MYTNVYAVTVWEKTTVNHTTVYVRHQTGSAYWEDTNGETIGNVSRDPDDKAFIVIHADKLGRDGYVPQPDDRIIKGAVNDAQPPKNALTVSSIKDFRYGSRRVRHVEVTAK